MPIKFEDAEISNNGVVVSAPYDIDVSFLRCSVEQNGTVFKIHNASSLRQAAGIPDSVPAEVVSDAVREVLAIPFADQERRRFALVQSKLGDLIAGMANAATIITFMQSLLS